VLQNGRYANAVEDRLHFAHADSRAQLLAMSEADEAPPPDAVYLDPMFPPKRKASALAKKSIRMVRALVGDDDDALELFAAALRSSPRARR
jgi:hypothetical protein